MCKVIAAIILILLIISIGMCFADSTLMQDTWKKNTEAKDSSQDYWLGVYYDNQKIGSKHITINRIKVDGKERLRRSEELKIRYKAREHSIINNSTHNIYVDNDYSVISEDANSYFKDSILGESFSKAEVIYAKDNVKTKLYGSGETKEATYPFLESDRLEAKTTHSYIFGDRKLSPGDSFEIKNNRLKILVLSDASSISSAKWISTASTRIKVLRREEATLDNTKYDALVVSEKGENVNTTSWCLDNGEIIKQEMPDDHLVLIKESKEKAIEVDEAEAPLLDIKQDEVKLSPPEILSQQPAEFDYWMGMYHGTKKIGYMHVITKPDKLDGKDVFRNDRSIHTALDIKDFKGSIDYTLTQYGGTNGAIILTTTRMTVTSSDGKSVNTCNTKSSYKQNIIDAIYEINGKQELKQKPFSDEDRAIADAGCAYALGLLKLEVQKSTKAHDLYYINNNAFNLNDMILTALRREKIDIEGNSYDALVVSGKTETNREVIKWLLDSGKVLKVEEPEEGITWLYEPKDKAMDLVILQ